jgi:hypothetical protein
MKTLNDTSSLSMLDLVAVREGGTVAEALAISLRTARHVEATRLYPLLAGRTPQHAGHRQFGHGRAGRPHRRRHERASASVRAA